MKKNTFIIFAATAVSLTLLIAGLILLLVHRSDKKSDDAAATADTVAVDQTDLTDPTSKSIVSTDSPQTEADTGSLVGIATAHATDAETEAVSESIPDETTSPIPSDSPAVPEDLTRVLGKNDMSSENVIATGCTQLVTVESYGSEAQVEFYRLENNCWMQDESLSCHGYVGYNGVWDGIYEGARATPKGLYRIGEAFYIYDKPATGLDTFEITENTYWVDDPDSSMYNRRVEGRENADWNSAEHMIDHQPYYNYGFVIEYNVDQVYNAGSAIFFHYKNIPTMGCIGIETDMLLQYLASLDKSANPYILIV